MPARGCEASFAMKLLQRPRHGKFLIACKKRLGKDKWTDSEHILDERLARQVKQLAYVLFDIGLCSKPIIEEINGPTINNTM